MNSMISSSRLLAAVLCGVVLAGCNAVEDVREEPFVPVPEQGVVLQGIVTGTLGNQRSVTLVNNGDDLNARSVSYTLGTPYTPFTFGVVKVGTPYKITVKINPFAKICTVTGGEGIITTAEAMHITVDCVNNPAVPRYNLRVSHGADPATFSNRAGATVTLTTEEGVFAKAAVPGSTFTVFENVLFNNVTGGTVWGRNAATGTSTANGGINPYTNISGGVISGATFAWRVAATTTEGSTPTKPLVNNCAMTDFSNFAGTTSGAPPAPNFGTAILPPVANIGFGTVQVPTVTGCSFTIGSVVPATGGPAGIYYSTAPGGTPQTLPTGGLDLQLRDVQGNVVETLTFTGGYGASGTAAGIRGTGFTFVTPGRSSASAVYDVAISRQPTGQTCIPHFGGSATLGILAANITNTHVACRAKPALANQLRGTYEFLDGTTYNYPTAAGTPTAVPTTVTDAAGTQTTTTVTTTVFDTKTDYKSTRNPDLAGRSRNQTLTSDVSTRTVVTRTPVGGSATTISDSGPILSVRVTENTTPTRNVLTFFEDGTFLHGMHGATTTSGQIEQGFYAYTPGASGAPGTITFTLITDTITSTASTNTVVTGLSGAPGATVAAPINVTMRNVVRGSEDGLATLSGEFVNTTGTAPAPIVTTVVGSARSGTPVAAVGARWSIWRLGEPETVPEQMTGTWVSQDNRRMYMWHFNTALGYHVGVNGGAANLQDVCYILEEYRNPTGYYTRRGGATGCLPGSTVLDIPSAPTAANPTPVGTPNNLTQLPGFVGRFPGSQIADGRSPSPVYYAVGSPATFGLLADAVFFPSEGTTPAALAWCTTEILGVRATVNGLPIDKPVYFCRTRAN